MPPANIIWSTAPASSPEAIICTVIDGKTSWRASGPAMVSPCDTELRTSLTARAMTTEPEVSATMSSEASTGTPADSSVERFRVKRASATESHQRIIAWINASKYG